RRPRRPLRLRPTPARVARQPPGKAPPPASRRAARPSNVASEARRRTLVLVCRGPECGDKRGSSAAYDAFSTELREPKPVDREVRLDWQSCFGQCRKGVNVLVREMRPGEDYRFVSFRPGGPGSALYHGVQLADVKRIVVEHVVGGAVVDDLR